MERAASAAPDAAAQPGEHGTPGSSLAGRERPPGLLPARPRTWVIEFPPGMELLTSNNRLHHMARHKLSEQIQNDAITLARVCKLPGILRASILVEYLRPARRHPLASAFVRDAGALAPTGKAIIDGFVKAGVFADDAARYVTSETYRISDKRSERGQIVVTITEVNGDAV
jgi:hypothetical protein